MPCWEYKCAWLVAGSMKSAAWLGMSEAFLVDGRLSLWVQWSLQQSQQVGCLATAPKQWAQEGAGAAKQVSGYPDCLCTCRKCEHTCHAAVASVLLLCSRFFGLWVRFPCCCCAIQLFRSMLDWGMSCLHGQLELIGSNFSVTIVLVVLCNLPMESWIQLNLKSGSCSVLHQCPVPSAVLRWICAEGWGTYECNFLEGGGNVCFSPVSD